MDFVPILLDSFREHPNVPIPNAKRFFIQSAKLKNVQRPRYNPKAIMTSRWIPKTIGRVAINDLSNGSGILNDKSKRRRNAK